MSRIPLPKRKYFKHETIFVTTKMIMNVCKIKYSQQFKRARERFGLTRDLSAMALTGRKKPMYNANQASAFVEQYLKWAGEDQPEKLSAPQVNSNLVKHTTQVAHQLRIIDDQLKTMFSMSMRVAGLTQKVEGLEDNLKTQRSDLRSCRARLELLESLIIDGRPLSSHPLDPDEIFRSSTP